MQLTIVDELDYEVGEVFWEAYVNAWDDIDNDRNELAKRVSYFMGLPHYTESNHTASFEKILAYVHDDLYFRIRDEIYEETVMSGMWRQASVDLEEFTENFYDNAYDFIDLEFGMRLDEINPEHQTKLHLLHYQCFFAESELYNVPLLGVW